MPKSSAGILLFRRKTHLEVMLVHPGGPFWKNIDEGAWSIPKGIFHEEEDPLEAARREFKEETGFAAIGDFIALDPVQQKGGKKVFAWAMEGDLDTRKIKSNHFIMEWPPKSGKQQEFPEIDRAEWYDLENAKTKINPAQSGFLKQLSEYLKK